MKYNWILSKERLPDKYGEYICTLTGEMDKGHPSQCTYFSTTGGKFRWATYDSNGFCFLKDKEVVAWMPLPEKYEEETARRNELVVGVIRAMEELSSEFPSTQIRIKTAQHDEEFDFQIQDAKFKTKNEEKPEAITIELTKERN